MKRHQLKKLIMEIVKQIHKINESFDLKPKNPDVKFPVSTFESWCYHGTC